MSGAIGRFGTRVTPALGYTGFRRLWLATLTSMMGFWMLSISHSWLMVELTDSVLVLVLVGFFQAVYLAMIQTILQLIVPNRLWGRVLSIWMLGWGLTPVGMLPMSAVAEKLGTPVAIMVFARQLWRLDSEADMEELGEDTGETAAVEAVESPGG